MFQRTANYGAGNRNATRRARRAASESVIATLSVVLLVSGCQTPGETGGFRLPGTTHLPKTPSVPTPKMKVGGNTPVVPGVTSNDQSQLAPSDPSLAGLHNGVAQVGFVDRIRKGGASCGSCQSCVQGGACGQCQTAMPVIPMGRPVDPQEFLCNGGDLPPEARVLRDDRISGLNPQDAIVHYTTEAGDIEIQPSNRVCVYSPRFGAIRQVSGAVAGEKSIGLHGTYQPVGPTGVGVTLPSLVVEDIDELAHANVARRVDAMRDRNRGVPVEGILQPVIAEDALAILATLDLVALNRLDESQIAILQQGAVAAEAWFVRDEVQVVIESMQPPVLIRDAKVESFVEYDFPDAGRLQIMKVADKQHAQQGEEVTFAISVRNVGDSPVNHVEIADNLVARLEYVEGSESCDREAEFETDANSVGSLSVKWTLTEPLAVGESAKIEFKCRVR